MPAPILQAVPNFSEGRDLRVIADIVAAMRAAGADVLDWSADPDHHRSVVTIVGSPMAVQDAAIEGAKVAARQIDLRRHSGAHPRIGSLDVLPFVPLLGTDLNDARRCAHEAGLRLTREVGVPVYYYAHASDPPGRGLAELRRGGFEALVDAWPEGREPDVLPDDWSEPGAHPAAGATCVGARKLLLAWNVGVEGITLETARRIAGRVRERHSGLRGVRALALELPSRGQLQISMNLEDIDATSPLGVMRAVESLVTRAGGVVTETEVIGMVPDRLVLEAAADRLRFAPATANRLLSAALLGHVLRTASHPDPAEVNPR